MSKDNTNGGACGCFVVLIIVAIILASGVQRYFNYLADQRKHQEESARNWINAKAEITYLRLYGDKVSSKDIKQSIRNLKEYADEYDRYLLKVHESELNKILEKAQEREQKAKEEEETWYATVGISMDGFKAILKHSSPERAEQLKNGAIIKGDEVTIKVTPEECYKFFGIKLKE